MLRKRSRLALQTGSYLAHWQKARVLLAIIINQHRGYIPAKGIALAQERQVALIVMGTHGRTGYRIW